MITHSYSSLSKYRTCPRMYEITKFKKLIEDKPGAAAQIGTFVHTKIERYLMNDVSHPDIMKYTKILAPYKELKGQCEVKYQLKQDLSVHTEDGKPFLIGYVDWQCKVNDTMKMADWKTGKVSPTDQMQLYSVFAFCSDEEVQKVEATFEWINKKDKLTQTFTRDRIDEYYAPFDDLIHQINVAIQTDTWEEKENYLCQKYCVVTDEYCSRGRPKTTQIEAPTAF